RDAVEVAPAVRALVRFEYLNLHDAVYPSLLTGTQGLDVIFCRNVLVYFAPEAAAATIARLRDCLVEGGWLVMTALDVAAARHDMEVIRFADVSLLRKPARAG